METHEHIEKPTWQREIENFAGIKPIFVLEGNVHDLYPLQTEDRLEFVTLERLLEKLLCGNQNERPYQFMFCDPLRGMTNPLGDPHMAQVIQAASNAADQLKEGARELNSSDAAEPFAENRLVHDSLLFRAALSRRLDSSNDANSRPVACVYDFASRLASSPGILTPEENAVFLNLQLGAIEAIRPDGQALNTLVLITNQASELPPWFYLDNPRVRQIAIPSPDRPARELFIDTAFPDLKATSEDSAIKKSRERLIDTTDSMRLIELDDIRRLYIKSGDSPSDIASLVDVYKYGIKENRWKAVAEKLRENPEEVLRRRVKGQDQAIDRIVTVLKRSVMGFSGMQHSSNTKPKGVLFLAGPTGTGKTEVVKAVTELLFGDERSYLRFDMSEYSQENSDQKLFGAPPGYVGYESGGQLTNAVRQNPFSVILFDEIEKAHRSIMDKFLQVLEDGRLTDGQGNTVYFTESLIFFTSNVGITKEVFDEKDQEMKLVSIVHPGQPYDEIDRSVKEAMRKHFKPEVLNRIGNNIVVFDYISPEASALILKAQIDKIVGNVKTARDITIEVDEKAFTWLQEKALEDNVRENGGRGIGNLVESAFLNPLSSFIFDEALEDSAHVTVSKTADQDRLTFTVSGGGQ